MKLYLVFDLTEKDVTNAVLGICKTENQAREVVYSYLTEEAELSYEDWDAMTYEAGFNTIEAFQEAIRHTDKYDDILQVKIDFNFFAL